MTVLAVSVTIKWKPYQVFKKASDELQACAESNHMEIQPDKVSWMLQSLSNLPLFILTSEGQPVTQEHRSYTPEKW